jgi:DNA polymerase IV
MLGMPKMSNKIALVSLDFAGTGSMCGGNKGVGCDGRTINREVRADRIRKSVGAENTFSSDLTELETMLSELQPLIDKVWRHCEDKGTLGRTMTLKVKFADFELISRSKTVSGKIDSRGELESASAELLRALFPLRKAVRLLGVSISGFYAGEIEHSQQIPLRL